MDKFGKIHRHRLKVRLEISKIAKSKSDLLKANEDAAQSKSGNLTVVCMMGGGHKLAGCIEN